MYVQVVCEQCDEATYTPCMRQAVTVDGDVEVLTLCESCDSQHEEEEVILSE